MLLTVQRRIRKTCRYAELGRIRMQDVEVIQRPMIFCDIAALIDSPVPFPQHDDRTQSQRRPMSSQKQNKRAPPSLLTVFGPPTIRFNSFGVQNS